MTRPLRLEFAGALYHVTSRGDRRGKIYRDDADRLAWQKVLALVFERHRFFVHSFCQMSNHYHLLVEMVESNLSQGMRQLNGLYSQHFNRRCTNGGPLTHPAKPRHPCPPTTPSIRSGLTITQHAPLTFRGSTMDHVYFPAAALQRKQTMGDGDCVTLIKEFTSAGPTMRWRAGAEVLNNPAIRPGTAIATFVKGRYPNHPTGNHAAFFLRHGVDGFWVIDQYKGRPFIQSRFISIKNLTTNGAFIDPSNNARAFSVIEAP